MVGGYTENPEKPQSACPGQYSTGIMLYIIFSLQPYIELSVDTSNGEQFSLLRVASNPQTPTG